MEKIRQLFFKYKEIILYVFFGGLTTAVNWVSYLLLVSIMGGAESTSAVMTATIVSQILSILFAYFTNRKWVFESKVKGAKPIAVEMTKFFGCRGASIVLDIIVMFVGVSVLHLNDAVMKLLSNVLIVIVNYLFSKVFIFKK